MKTTVNIPDELLEQTMELTGATTKREAIISAMETFNRRARAAQFIQRIEDGPALDFATNEEIEKTALGEENRVFRYYHEPEPQAGQ